MPLTNPDSLIRTALAVRIGSNNRKPLDLGHRESLDSRSRHYFHRSSALGKGMGKLCARNFAFNRMCRWKTDNNSM